MMSHLGPPTKYPASDAAGCIKAGNDLTMPGSQSDLDTIIKSVGAKVGEVRYPLTLAELQVCAYRVLRTIFDVVGKREPRAL